MSSIPRTRQDVSSAFEAAVDKLRRTLDEAGRRAGSLAVGETVWTVKELLGVRSWWSEQVVAWIEAGRRGESPVTPAEGFAWSQTPRLNEAIATSVRRDSYMAVRRRLEVAQARVRETIDDLDDTELLGQAQFDWAGKWSLARWISVNTTRQYETARTMIRRAIREARSD